MRSGPSWMELAGVLLFLLTYNKPGDPYVLSSAIILIKTKNLYLY